MSYNTTVTIAFIAYLTFIAFMCWQFSPWFVLLVFLYNPQPMEKHDKPAPQESEGV